MDCIPPTAHTRILLTKLNTHIFINLPSDFPQKPFEKSPSVPWELLLTKSYLKATKVLEEIISIDLMKLLDHLDWDNPLLCSNIRMDWQLHPEIISPLTKCVNTESAIYCSLYSDDLRITVSESSNHFLVTRPQIKSLPVSVLITIRW